MTPSPPSRRWRLGITFALLATACGESSAPTPVATTPLAPGDHQFTVPVGSVTRRYVLHVPPAAAGSGAASRPVLLAFHGGGGNAAQFQRTSAFDAHADRTGYLVAYPDGTGTLGALSWNAGGCCSTALTQRVDDVAFTRALVDDLARRTSVDRARIYVTGHSNGAMIAHRVAAEASDLIAAAAPYAGSPYFGLTPFAPQFAVPVLHIHSVDDPLALFAGGVSGEGTYKTPLLEQLRFWTTRNGCPAAGVADPTVPGAPGTINAGQTVTRVPFAPCSSGAEVHWLRLTGAGHAWPGMELSSSLREQLGPPTSIIAIEDEIWQFVSRYRR